MMQRRDVQSNPCDSRARLCHTLKGIVAAIRNFQGRFLKLDESNGSYYDIGDKQAMNKTSQALREGQSKIRQLLRFKYECEIAYTPEEYFAYSVKVLSQLYSEDKNSDILLNHAKYLQLPPLPPPKRPLFKQSLTPSHSQQATKHNASKIVTSKAAVEMALDQFPMASPNISQKRKPTNIHMHCGNGQSPTAHHKMQSNYNMDLKTDNRSHCSDMDVSMASLSTISAIHTISSDFSSEASHPKGCRGSFDTMITSNSHRKMFEAEKHFYELDFIDEATTFEEASCRNISESFIESNTSTFSNTPLMEESVCGLSMGSDTEEMVNHLLGLSDDDDGFNTSFEI